MLQPYDGIPDGDSARSVVEVMARSWAEPALGNDQGDEQLSRPQKFCRNSG